MKHKKKGRFIPISALWLFIIALLLFSVQAMAVSAAMMKTITVTIEETTEDNFISDSGEFRIIEKTVLLNQDGEVSDLRYIRLPCKAILTYKTSNAEIPIALEIRVIETLRRKNNKDPHLPE
jgi:hypothetical protein